MADEPIDTIEHNRCNKMLEHAVVSNMTIQFLINNIEKLGCSLPQGFVVCRECPADEISGGFAVDSINPNLPYKPVVVICENKKLDKTTFENTIVHELIHAYDKCRAKIDFSNCLHHACAEVRASALSGECSYFQEVRRGHSTIQKGHQKCVARRAEKSITNNPNCKGMFAKQAIAQVFEECYRDTAPFERPP
eukprot:gene7944-16272_t